MKIKAERVVNTLGMSKAEWLAHRREGIGGSEVATIMGLNKWQTAIELFYDKVEGLDPKPTNAAMFMGNFLEDKVAELYMYWDKDMDTMMKNYEEGNKVNYIRRVNHILRNKQYPILLGNLDREIYYPEKAVLEIKTASGYTLDQWEAEIPPMYIIQAQAYMMITGYSLKLAVLKDGRSLEVYDIPANEDIQEGIIITCNKFWDRVLYARQLKAEGKPFESMEPDPDSTEAYEKFMKTKFVQKPERIEVGEELHKVALHYVECGDKMKDIKEEQQLYKNQLISAMRDNELMSFGLGKGYCTLKANKSGTKVFLCKPEIPKAEEEAGHE